MIGWLLMGFKSIPKFSVKNYMRGDNMFKIDFGFVFVDADGKSLLDEGDKEKRPLTLKKIAVLSLVNMRMAEKISGSEKYERYKLFKKIDRHDGVVEISEEERAMLRSLIGDFYGPLVMGQAWDILDSATIDA